MILPMNVSALRIMVSAVVTDVANMRIKTSWSLGMGFSISTS